tara:strand:+ start:645 stop:854 length:210 start_codon:yes stop_codon:yes gene_type:complete
VRRVTSEAFLVSAQSHHLVELGDAADNHCELAAFFCFSGSALQALTKISSSIKTMWSIVINLTESLMTL